MYTIIPSNFESEVIEPEGVVVLFARRSTCGLTCRCEGFIEPIENTYRNKAKFVGFFFEDYPELARELGLMSVASVRVYKDGEAVGEDINISRFPEQLTERLEELTA